MAVQQDGRAIEYAHADLKRCRWCVLAAVQNNGYGCRDARVFEVIRVTGAKANRSNLI